MSSFVSTLVGLAALAAGYILPSSILLRQMAVQRSAQLSGNFEVSGTLTLTGDVARKLANTLGLPAQDPLSVPTKLSFSSGKCVVSAGRGATVTNDRGQVTPADASALAWLARLGCLPFLFRGEGGEGSLEGVMRKAGGRFDESSLTFENGDVAYVFGAGETGTGKTGLVVQKHGLLPLRAWEEEGGSRVDVLFRGYRLVFHDGGFPTRLELHAADAVVATFAASP